MPVPVAELSIEARAALTSGRDLWTTTPSDAAGIASIRMGDGPMGIASGRVDERDIALLTPAPIALGASWDVDLIGAIGGLVASEARERGVDVVLAPNVNLPRSPLTGRLFEMFAEDPFLTGVLASAWIKGVQTNGVGTAVKHFVANDSETDRHSMNAVVDEATLREIYLQPFEHCVQAGAWGLMTAYNRINGTWCSSAHDLLTDVVKDEWGFDGVVLSDWFGTHGVEDAAAGLDLEMPGPARHLGAALVGAVPDTRIDDAATRVARLVALVGARTPQPLMAKVDALALLAQAAIAGSVLLRNEGNLLPLAPDTGTLAVIGPNAASPCIQGGSFARIATDPGRPGPVAAIAARFGAERVSHVRGLAPDTRLPPLHSCDIIAPDGEKGVLVEILGEDGVVLSSEVRDTSLLIWFAEMPGLGKLDKRGGIRVRTRFTARMDGVHRFLFGGTGLTRLSIGGEEVGAHDPQVEPADIMGALMGGETVGVDRALDAGDAIELDYVMRFEPARAQGLWFGCVEPSAADEQAEAVALARVSDAVVLIVGESQDAALESIDRITTRLAAAQVALIEAVCAVNPRTLVVVNAARPVHMDWADRPAAILQVWFPGQEFGDALAQMIAGDAEPGGRLPLSFATSEQDYPAFDLTPDEKGDVVYRERDRIGYRGMLAAGCGARFPFGYGLGYADIEMAAPTMSVDDARPVFAVGLHNRSARDGKAVIQLYAEDAIGNGLFGPSRLVGFAVANLVGGARQSVDLVADPLASRVWDAQNGQWQASSECVRYTIGLSAEDRRFQSTFDGQAHKRMLEIGQSRTPE